ncbi:hypothetical protein FRC03_005751 [Tulasnella sp. 419]|nr:hypothetical protein FRC03_005751 [Tulasnella sp. 419]
MMPLLESFTGRDSYHLSDSDALPTSIQEYAPNYKGLSIGTFSFSLGCSALAKLELLTITPSINNISFNILQWHSFFSSASQLIYLDIIGDNITRLPPRFQIPPVRMPRLQHLCLWYLPVTVTIAILQCIAPDEDQLRAVEIAGP